MVMRRLGKSPHCLNFYEIHETENSLYVVVELLTGNELLKTILTSGLFKYNTVRKLVKNMLLGLEHMEKNGVMHRDLKPENIILKSSENSHEIKLVDFGLASLVDVKEYIYPRCGTPGYVAPEIITFDGKNRYNSKVDVFSAGVIFYVL